MPGFLPGNGVMVMDETDSREGTWSRGDAVNGSYARNRVSTVQVNARKEFRVTWDIQWR